MGEPVERGEAEIRPREIHGHMPAAGADEGRGLFEQGCRLAHARQAFDARQQRFAEAFGASSPHLQVRRADDLVHDFAGRAGDAAVGDQRRRHERHGDGYAKAGEQLLRGVDAQAVAVQVDQARTGP